MLMNFDLGAQERYSDMEIPKVTESRLRPLEEDCLRVVVDLGRGQLRPSEKYAGVPICRRDEAASPVKRQDGANSVKSPPWLATAEHSVPTRTHGL